MSISKLTTYNKLNGNTLEASEWNDAIRKINELVDSSNEGGGSSGGTTIDTSGVLSVNNKGNITLGNNNIKNINIEPGYPYNSDNTKYGDIALKPGDDILFASHHREFNKRDKVVVKNIDGSDNPVKLNVVAGELYLQTGTNNNRKSSTKKKSKLTGEDTDEYLFKSKVTDASQRKDEVDRVFDLAVLSGYTLDEGGNDERDERAYLKVRAQAIDLRCEKHGGIALQPKGYDNDGNMNKIKFEHGGGDGLEFGTFNTEKTSLFTDEYRFKKDGVWKMAVRETEESGKTILDEGTIPTGKRATGVLKYKKNNATNNSSKSLRDLKTYEAADDFYDFIDTTDEQCTTKDIIKTAYAMNGFPTIHTKVTNKGNLEISTSDQYLLMEKGLWEDVAPSLNASDFIDGVHDYSLNSKGLAVGNYYSCSEVVASFYINESDYIESPLKNAENGDILYLAELVAGESLNPTEDSVNVYKFKKICANGIKIDSATELKLGGVLDFGSTFNFGETDKGIEVQYKLTKQNNTKDCGVLKVIGINNNTKNTLTITTASPSDGTVQDYVIPAAEQVVSANTYTPQTIASCSINDIIMFVNWAKGTGFGPWSSQAIADKELLEWDGSGFAAVTQ